MSTFQILRLGGVSKIYTARGAKTLLETHCQELVQPSSRSGALLPYGEGASHTRNSGLAANELVACVMEQHGNTNYPDYFPTGTACASTDWLSPKPAVAASPYGSKGSVTKVKSIFTTSTAPDERIPVPSGSILFQTKLACEQVYHARKESGKSHLVNNALAENVTCPGIVSWRLELADDFFVETDKL